jgi:hypothetical protein
MIYACKPSLVGITTAAEATGVNEARDAVDEPVGGFCEVRRQPFRRALSIAALSVS